MADNKKTSNGETATMSDNKKKTNGEAPPPTTSKGSKFAEKFNRFINLCNEMKNDSAGALDYEKTVDDNNRLKKALEKRDGEVDALEAEVERLNKLRLSYVDDFEMKCVDYNSKLKDVESTRKALDRTQGKLEDANNKIKKLEVEKGKFEMKAREKEALLRKTAKELSEREHRVRELEFQLTSAQKKINFYGEDQLIVKDTDNIAEQFQIFADKCHQVVMECFYGCEAPPKDINTISTSLASCNGNFGAKLPLSRSTSPAARLMRCAAAELVLINALYNHIFTDVYIPGAVQYRRAVSTTLQILNDPQREALVRCQLLAEFETQADTFQSVAQPASNEVCTALDSLLPAGEPRQKFQTKLAELLKDAFELWRSLQASTRRVYADMSVDPHILERDTDFYSDYDYGALRNATNPSMLAPAGQAVQLLFPMVCIGEEVAFNPKALWSDQAAVVDARDELAAERTSIHGGVAGVPDVVRQPVARRRNSISARNTQSPVNSAVAHRV